MGDGRWSGEEGGWRGLDTDKDSYVERERESVVSGGSSSGAGEDGCGNTVGKKAGAGGSVWERREIGPR